VARGKPAVIWPIQVGECERANDLDRHAAQVATRWLGSRLTVWPALSARVSGIGLVPVCFNVSGLGVEPRPRWRSAQSGPRNHSGVWAIESTRFPGCRSPVGPSASHTRKPLRSPASGPFEFVLVMLPPLRRGRGLLWSAPARRYERVWWPSRRLACSCGLVPTSRRAGPAALVVAPMCFFARR
jgi:hypothetical protein